MYGYFFDYEGETIRLPVNPEKVTIKVSNQNKTIDLISAKEYTTVAGDSLWAIAKRELNDGSRYQEIADLRPCKPTGTGMKYTTGIMVLNWTTYSVSQGIM